MRLLAVVRLVDKGNQAATPPGLNARHDHSTGVGVLVQGDPMPGSRKDSTKQLNPKQLIQNARKSSPNSPKNIKQKKLNHAHVQLYTLPKKSNKHMVTKNK